jgi:hypothetical protein
MICAVLNTATKNISALIPDVTLAILFLEKYLNERNKPEEKAADDNENKLLP